MEKSSKFQIIILIVFGVAIVVGALLFGASASKPSSKNPLEGASIVIWGTLPKATYGQVISQLNVDQKTSATYIQMDPSVIESNFINSIASGNPPDLLVIPDDIAIRQSNYLLKTTYASYPVRLILDTFIPVADSYRDAEGIFALPIIVDPLILYYNRTLFANAGIPLPPKDWDEFLEDVKLLTKKNKNLDIEIAGGALGTYDNVNHAKDILAMMMMQRGDNIVGTNANGQIEVKLGRSTGANSKNSAEEALAYYTNFSNPTNADIYTWNGSFDQARNLFSAGQLAMYLGYTSELFNIQAKNPNLDFDVSTIPQIKNTSTFITLGHSYSIAVAKNSKNPASAYAVWNLLTNQQYVALTATKVNLSPARRDLLVTPPQVYYGPVFYRSALISRVWSDPNEIATNQIFRDMIGSINSGLSNIPNAISAASANLQLLIP